MSNPDDDRHGIGRLILRSEATAAATVEAVNHPAHYGGDTTYEAIKVIEAWVLGFHDGNAAKYICRQGMKGRRQRVETGAGQLQDPAKRLEDLKKARWYLDRLIQQLETK